jgi:predicted phage-related endonuclease
MKYLTLTQGTAEWHEARLAHFTASEAAAMMGDSKYMSRDELLELKSTGIAKEVTEFQQ